jgi:hypothetical protein
MLKNFASLSLSLESQNLSDLRITAQIKVKLVKREQIFHTISITCEQHLLQVRDNSKKGMQSFSTHLTNLNLS